MVLSLLLCLFASFVIFTQGKDAEYCKHYPGDIAFSYSTTQDEYFWFQNYQNAYTGKKGGGAWHIYRRRTVITRRPRPHGYRPSIYNNMNNMNNLNNEFQQVQQVQQVQEQGPQQASIPVWDLDHSNETEEEEKPALPIWKVTIPRQVSRAVVARIENGQVVESFELNSTHFENPNTTTSSSHSAARNKLGVISSAPSVQTRIIDITDQSIITDAWYAVCIDVNTVEKGKPHKCNRCTLLQARTDGGRQRFLDVDWETSSFQNTTAELRYSATDIPFPWAVMRTKVWTKPPHPRCVAEPEKVVFESKDYAYPDHFTYVPVKNLIGKMAYDVQVDLEFPWKKENDGVLPKPFTVTDYLHSDTGTTLAKCDDYSYTGE